MEYYGRRGGSYVGEWRQREWDEDAWDMEQGRMGRWKPARREGDGTYTFVSGDVYEGQWTHDFMTGDGMMTFADGGYFEGTWRTNHPVHGTRIWPNGDGYSGEWTYTRDELKYDGLEYDNPQGDVFKKDQRHGSGGQEWANGDEFEGYWHQDLPSSHPCNYWDGRWNRPFPLWERRGVFTYANGDVYEGEFLAGQKEADEAF